MNVNQIWLKFSYAIKQQSKCAIKTPTETLTYQDALERVIGIAEILENQDVKFGDIIALNIQDEISHFLVSLSLLLLGAKHFTIAGHDTEIIHGRLLNILQPKFILTQEDGNEYKIKFIVINRDIIEARKIESASPVYGHSFAKYKHNSDGTIFLKTSGTTGHLNIVEFSSNDIEYQARRHSEYINNSLLRLASIEHNNSKRHRLYVFFNLGLNIFRINDDGWINLFNDHSLQLLDISRLHILDLLHRYPNHELLGLKIRTGGSAIPQYLRDEVTNKLSPQFYVRYATTEFGGIAMADPSMHLISGCVGRVLNGVNLDIVDDSDNLLQKGHVGRVRLSGFGACRFYSFSETEQINSNRFRNQFFYPGDMGFVTNDGLLVIQGREDDMMIMNGLNIFPDEVESVLGQISNIKSVVCFSYNSNQHGEIPVAAVILNDRESGSELKILMESKKILGLKAPRKIFIVDELPVNSAGKFDRKKLKSTLLQ